MNEEIEDIYSTRLLVFIEDNPQSNKYHQMFFTPEEFKRISMAIGKDTGRKNGRLDIIEFQQSVETYALPDLQEIQYIT